MQGAATAQAAEEERVALVVQTAKALLDSGQAAEAGEMVERSLQTCSRRHRCGRVRAGDVLTDMA